MANKSFSLPATEDEITFLLTALRKDHATTITQYQSGSFELSGHGVTASVMFDPEKQSLTVNIFTHPFFIPVETIENALEDLLSHAPKTQNPQAPETP